MKKKTLLITYRLFAMMAAAILFAACKKDGGTTITQKPLRFTQPYMVPKPRRWHPSMAMRQSLLSMQVKFISKTILFFSTIRTRAFM